MFDHLCILFGSWKTGSYHSCKVTSNVQLVGHELYLKLLYTATLNVEYGYVQGLCLLRSNCLKFRYGGYESNFIAIQIHHFILCKLDLRHPQLSV